MNSAAMYVRLPVNEKHINLLVNDVVLKSD